MHHEPDALRVARLAAGWSQPRLIAAMRAAALQLGLTLPSDESLKTSIKRWERGHVVPSLPYQRIFQHVYGSTADQLRFPALESTIDLRATFAEPLHLSGEELAYYGSLLSEHLAADNLFGPRQALQIVRHQVNILSQAARESRGRSRFPVLRMACRYFEFYGWLLQDMGRCGEATISTDRARDLATELDDTPLMAYLMMRRSNIATDNGDPALAAGLARAALSTHGPQVSLKIRAVLWRQVANSYAGLQQSKECSAAISESLDLASPDVGDDHRLADYCTPSYLAMEAGTCWLDLGDPSRALNAFAYSTGEWDPAFRRDQGLSLARQATAHAGVGDIVTACSIARQAVAIATVTRSVRTLKELSRLSAQLSRSPKDGQAQAVRQEIRSLTAVA